MNKKVEKKAVDGDKFTTFLSKAVQIYPELLNYGIYTAKDLKILLPWGKQTNTPGAMAVAEFAMKEGII